MHKHQFMFTALAVFALSFVFLPNLSAQTKTGAKHEKSSHAKMAGSFPATKEKIPHGETFEFKQGKIYEFAALWFKPGKEKQLAEYFNQAFPIAVKYGVHRLAGFVPVNVYRGDLKPQIIGLNQWPSQEAFQKFIKDADLQKLLPTRDEALSRLVVNHNRVRFEEGAR